MNKFFSYLKHSWKAIIATIILVGICFGVYFIFFNKNNKQKDINEIQKESSALVAKVAKLIYLPEGEVPTIATVTDLNALKGQVFFVDAQKGDKVLIYTKAKKAVLYNPKSNKIVTVAPLSVDSKQQPLQY